MQEKKVLAVVNGEEITESDVEFLLRSIDPQRARQFNSEEGKKYLLEELINQKLFYIQALEDGLIEDEAFKREAARLLESLLKDYALSKIFSNVTVDEDEIQEYYNQNKNMFISPESVRASHILVDSKEKAEEILEEMNNGLSFEEAASKYSSCPSKSNGGDLGYFTRGRMVPEFEQAAFEMEKGSISNPVKTQFGYHIIKLTDRKEEGLKSLDEVREQIKYQVTDMKYNLIYFNKVDELRKKYKVEIKHE